MRIAKVLTAAGLIAPRRAPRSRGGAAAAGAALLAGSAFTRFGIFEAGMASARDPRYTVEPQRARADATITLDVYPAVDRAAEAR